MKLNRSLIGWVVGLVVLSCVLTGFAIAADDTEAPAETTTVGQISPGSTLAGGAGGAAGGAGGGATGGGGADIRVAQY